jgi:translation initiation factor 2 subunit 2
MDFNTLLDALYDDIGLVEPDHINLPNPDIEKGTTRIIWKNIGAFLKMIRAPSEHFIDFMIKESGFKMNLDTKGLIIHHARINNGDIVKYMKKYVENYIICNICKKSDTQIIKDHEIRKYKIKCNACNSVYTI